MGNARPSRTMIFAAVISGSTAISVPSVQAEPGSEFFKGKVITYIVSTSAGGGYDTYGRLIATQLQKYLPGSNVIVKNVPGAGNMVGGNTIYVSKPDGLTIGTFATSLIYYQLSGKKGVRFDLNKMSWIGKAASESRAIVVGVQSPIKTFKDLVDSKSELKFSSTAVGSATYSELSMIIRSSNLPVKLITGYNGNADQLAIRRGEVTGTIGSRSSFEDFVRNGYGRFVVQIGGKKTDTPMMDDAATSPMAKSVSNLIGSLSDTYRVTAGPPGIPAEQLLALRTAYKKGSEDPEYISSLKQAGLPYDPAYGEDVARLISKALDQTPESIALLKDVLAAKNE